MIITIEQLKQKKACAEGIAWFKERYENSINRSVLTNDLITAKKYGWFKWMIEHLCDDIEVERKIEMAIKCALVVYQEEPFVDWANSWLSGINRDRSAAKAAAQKAAAALAAARSAEAIESAEWSALAAAAVESAAWSAWAAEAETWSAEESAAKAAAWAAAAAAWSAAEAEANKVILSYVS